MNAMVTTAAAARPEAEAAPLPTLGTSGAMVLLSEPESESAVVEPEAAESAPSVPEAVVEPEEVEASEAVEPAVEASEAVEPAVEASEAVEPAVEPSEAVEPAVEASEAVLAEAALEVEFESEEELEAAARAAKRATLVAMLRTVRLMDMAGRDETLVFTESKGLPKAKRTRKKGSEVVVCQRPIE